MIKFLKRIPWKDVLVTILVVALGVGAVVGVGAAITNKQKTVSPLVFERGALDENGLHVESKTSIYTKDLIECQGLEITPDFEASGTYQVFYYDTNKIFIGATSVMDAHSVATYKKGADFPYAAYARIVITPEVPVDDDGYVDEDYKVKFYEVTSIASKYTIKVNKEQKKIGVMDYFAEGKIFQNRIFSLEADRTVKYEETEGYNICEIRLENKNVVGRYMDITFENAPGNLSTVFIDSNGVAIERFDLNTEDINYKFVVPEGTAAFIIIYKTENIPVINVI